MFSFESMAIAETGFLPRQSSVKKKIGRFHGPQARAASLPQGPDLPQQQGGFECMHPKIRFISMP
ncbi:MAG TPA: hypothetical protein DEF16_00145 [Gemmobacter sp.]|nr:MAG: hypothetical protein A2X69_13685 [Rhodobacteraceae bacterium GWF1_65_7]HBD89846.1 hypothetical protein [Gemmobacter sp.]HBU13428.1 hypothetical protein [Gemmobacter sp.]